jgi:hypothetical protein
MRLPRTRRERRHDKIIPIEVRVVVKLMNRRPGVTSKLTTWSSVDLEPRGERGLYNGNVEPKELDVFRALCAALFMKLCM